MGAPPKNEDGGISPHGGSLKFMGGLQNPLETMFMSKSNLHALAKAEQIKLFILKLLNNFNVFLINVFF